MRHINHELLKPKQYTALLKLRKFTPLSLGFVLHANHDDEMAYSQAPSSSTCFSKKDIAEAITDNATDNFSKIVCNISIEVKKSLLPQI